jgi:hypothetical protein
LLILVGCSRVGILYRTSDIVIENYADDYLELDSAQLADWRPNLRNALDRHREDELPHLARFFEIAYQGTQQGFDRQRSSCLIDQFEDLYRRHIRIAVGLAAPLLADLTREQIRKLEARFDEEAEDETRHHAAAKARRERKRAERYAMSMDWWFGSLTENQHRIIEVITAEMPDTAASWESYRNAKRARLIALLDRGADAGKLSAFLGNWLVEHRDLPKDLRRARSLIREQIVELLVRMDASFSEQQRSHFARRIASIRDDFMSLQRRPKMAATVCTTPS